MKIRLYIDEDAMSHALVQGLRARSVDVTTVLEERRVGESDDTQLDYASKHGRVIYTFNVGHFCQLHSYYLAQDKNHSGIIVVYRQRYSVGEQMRRLLRIIETKSAEEMHNSLIFL